MVALNPVQTVFWARVDAIHLRRLSTVTPTGRPDPADDKVPPLSPTPPRKPKTALKPGPVKPAALRSDHCSPHPPTHSSPDGKKASHHYHPPRHMHPPKAFQTDLSVLELAKRDIVEATEKGVLDPPPKDAGSIKRFGHHVFQLLVCFPTPRSYQPSSHHCWVDYRNSTSEVSRQSILIVNKWPPFGNVSNPEGLCPRGQRYGS